MDGVIVHAQYGLDEASNLAKMDPTDYGDLSTVATNHYEVVLTIDMSGVAGGKIGLPSGAYTLELIAPTTPTGSTTKAPACATRPGSR